MNDPTIDELNQIRNPVRKRNRLEKYDYSSAGLYFITICTKDKEKIFGNIVDRIEPEPPIMYLSDMGKIIDQQIRSINQVPFVHVETYVVMPNHVHMILRVDDHNQQQGSRANELIPSTIGGFKRICAKRIGRDVFQRSYHDNVIRTKRRFDLIWNYIEDNPRRWKEDRFYEP